MKILIYKSITYLLVLSLFTNIGCYTYSRGDFVRYTEVPNSQILKNNEFNYKVSTQPSYRSPHLVLSFQKTSVYQYSAIEYYNEVVTPTEGASDRLFYLFSGGILSALVGILKVLGVGSHNSEGWWFIGGGIGGALLAVILSLPEGNKKVIEGSTVIKDKKDSAFLIDINININIENRSKIYTTNRQGEIIIDLVSDYGLNNFEEEKIIKIKFEFLTNKTDTLSYQFQPALLNTLELKSSSWTQKYFSIIADEIQVYDTPGSNGKKLGVCRKSEKYVVIGSESSGWTNVDFNGNNGWISAYAGKYVWLAN